jgi:hypothetical protein
MSKTATKELLTHTVDKQIQNYVALRDRIKEMDEAHKVKLKPFKDALEELNGKLLEFLEASGTEAVKTKYGTCYSSVRYTASLPNAQDFMDFVINNERFELLDKKANSTAVRAYVEEVGALPPGCQLSALRTAGVRRGKGDDDAND